MLFKTLIKSGFNLICKSLNPFMGLKTVHRRQMVQSNAGTDRFYYFIIMEKRKGKC